MRKLMILSATVLLASATGAFAEDNADLLQPVSFGATTGDAEKDTVAYDPAVPSDLWVRFEDDCSGRRAPLQEASLDMEDSGANDPRTRLANNT